MRRSPPTGSRCGPGSASTTSRPSPTTSPRSASPTSTCRRSCRPRPGRRTGTTSSTTRSSPPRPAAARRSTRMTAALAERGLSAIADVVPNHMAVPTPARLNAALWSVLRDGPGSPYARWFDVDWTVPGPVAADAGARAADRAGAGGRRADRRRLRRRAGAALLRPRVPGPARHRGPAARRAGRPAVVPAGLVADGGRRAELPALLRRRHARRRPGRGPGGVRRRRTSCCSTWSAPATLTGLRIDHPDGLADPRGYLRRLAEATGRRLGRGREDPRGRRGAAGRLAVRRDHRLRRAGRASAGCSSTRRARRRCRRCSPS